MPKKYTAHGRRIYAQFTDTYGSEAKIQMSSCVAKRCWVFVKGSGGDAALHLNAQQARRIIKALQAFIADE